MSIMKTRLGCGGSFVVCIAFIGTIAIFPILLSHLTSKKFEPGEVPPRHFPIVAYAPGQSDQGEKQYVFMTWDDLSSAGKANCVFRLPEAQGRLPWPDPNNHVSFKVIEDTDYKQVVEVLFVGDWDTFISQYSVMENNITPVYYRRYGMVEGMLGVIPALIVVILVTKAWGYRHGPPNNNVHA